MIVTTLSFSVSGNNYEEIMEKAKTNICNFLDIAKQELDKKCNIEISVSDQTDSLEFDEDDYVAQVTAQVKNV